MNKPVSYSIIIPVYNSTDSLIELVSRIQKVFAEISLPYEIIFVDDASPNRATWPVLENLANNYTNISCFQLMRNFGKSGALICGFKKAIGEFIITMDDDLQHFPEDIPKLISLNVHDVVVGNFTKKHHPYLKRLTSDINRWFEYKLIGKPRHIKNGPFKLIHADIIKAALKIRTPYPYISALIFYVTKDIVNIEVSHGERKFNETGFTWNKMVRNFSHLLINNSSFLLQKIAVLGISIAVLSFMMGIYFLIKKLTVGMQVQGWASLAVINLFLGGLILFSIGVVGEYLIRIINGVERKPSYIVRKGIKKPEK